MINAFDELVERRGTHSIKWDALTENFGRDDLLPMWVADMDFRTPDFVLEAIRARLEHGVLGYTMAGQDWSQAIVNWLAHRFGWQVSPENLCFVSGVVRGQAHALQCFTQPGDSVLILSPVYHPFYHVTSQLGRRVVASSLCLDNDEIAIDFDVFARDVRGCRAMILCNPHNPGGRVWTREELERIADICYNEQVFVISDEIHADLTLLPYRHWPFAMVSEKAAQNSLTLMSPSKAFNMPGVASSYAVVMDAELNQRFKQFMAAGEFDCGHLFAYDTLVAAYTHGEEWLHSLLHYIQGNIDFVEQFLREEMPQISMIRPQASFLIYLNCSKLHLSQPELVRLFLDQAHLALNDGSMFGKEGVGYMRLNVGCPRSVVAQALQQLKNALHTLG